MIRGCWAAAKAEAPLARPVCLRGGGGGGGPSACIVASSSLICILPILTGTEEGSNGGGSFLGPELDADAESIMEGLTCSYGDVEMLENEDKRDSDRGIVTQSGSSVGA